MNGSWLLLAAAALAFGPAAFSAASLGRKDQTQRRLPLRGNQPCIGCYTLLSAPLLPEDRAHAFENATLALLVEPSRQPPHPALRTNAIKESTLFDPELGSLDLRLNSKPIGEEKRAGPGRRRSRSRQRAGTRPVCRGCYSGLMIVAPPGRQGNHTGMQESHSESAWESSEED